MNLHLSHTAMEMIEAASAAESAAEAGRRLFQGLQPFGVRAFYARAHRSADPEDVLSYSRISPPGWLELYSEYAIAQHSPLNRAMRQHGEPFTWSTLPGLWPVEREIMNILPCIGVSDGIGAPVHGPGGYVGVTSMAFERLDQLSPRERSAIGIAAMVVHMQMRRLSPRKSELSRRLSPRERDCLAFVADGKSDWEVSEILSLSETTVASHMQNARRKLGAKSRAQAVALALQAGLI
jgi:LuxR family quorum sensing-dependent transcriptional regulator